jgi:hypothetical protein
MDKKSKVLLFIFLVLILLSVAATYYNMIIKRNFVVIDSTETSIDTQVASSTN